MDTEQLIHDFCAKFVEDLDCEVFKKARKKLVENLKYLESSSYDEGYDQGVCDSECSSDGYDSGYTDGYNDAGGELLD